MTVLDDQDIRLRLAAFAQLQQAKAAGGGVVTDADLEAGFEFGGETIKFWNRARGIWRPRQLAPHGAALSITTAPPRPGKKPPYDDQLASNAESFVYRYQGTDPNEWTNVAVRESLRQGRPLIYLYGIAPSIYEPIFPCYVVVDDPENLAFHVAADEAAPVALVQAHDPNMVAARRAYTTASVRVRLHQRRFRALVVSAYGNRCTVCRLGHTELLDAAHILPDRDERGRPEVPNGLALCRIHHGAYDTEIMGVDPDYRVHIRPDVLREKDGPMLTYGLQALHGSKIIPPRLVAHRPNREYLAERFGHFRAA